MPYPLGPPDISATNVDSYKQYANALPPVGAMVTPEQSSNTTETVRAGT